MGRRGIGLQNKGMSCKISSPGGSSSARGGGHSRKGL